MTDRGQHEGGHEQPRSDAEVIASVAATMRDVFGARAIEIATRQIEMTDADRPEVAARWREIREALETLGEPEA